MTLAMNQSLTPTRLDAPFSPSNYPDKRSVVAAYKRMVQMVLDTAEDRAALQKALKEFHRTFLVEDLMDSLKGLLNHPRRRQLYLAIRPLIPSRQRPEYNSLIPHIPSFNKKVIHLKQPGSRSHGFTIRGGKEFDCGIYVTSVLTSSKADQCGLKPGDELLRVNGLTLSATTHEEVVNLIKLKRTLMLTLREVGMVPENKSGSNNITWKTVAEDKIRKTPSSRLAAQGPMLKSTKRIQVTLEGNNLLGASIKSSNDPDCGVFIVDVVPNSVGHNAGLRVGDELIEVNGQSLIYKQHSEAISLLKSSESLMLTIRVEEPSTQPSGSASSNPGHYDPLSNPPEDFELNPHDFDIDAELIPTDLDQSTGFVLKPKLDIHRQAAEKGADLRRQRKGQLRHETDRLSLLDMEISRSKNTPLLASPAAVGFGPTMAMPTLMGMMPEMPNMEDGAEQDTSLISAPSFSPDGKLPQFHLSGASVQGEARQSVALDMSNFSGEMPASIANIFQSHGREEGQEQIRPAVVQQPPPTAPKPKRESVERKSAIKEEPNEPQQPSHNISGADLASYQFPVDEEEEESLDAEGEPTRHEPSLNRQPSTSAMKKSPSDHSLKGAKGGKPKKTPAFRESVEIINVHEQAMASSSNDTLSEVHPSNMEFSEEVLQGRQVAFHTVPKDGPIKIAIRGGTDTPLGGQIIISRILEGGAADRYGRLNVGDQILVCDGVSLIEVTHDEAAQALKRAMDMESASIDLVVAVSLDAWQEEDGENGQPMTFWPPEDDTLCDQHPSTPKRQFDFAKSAHRSHSGFTLRGKDKDIASTAHAFLPRVPPQ